MQLSLEGGGLQLLAVLDAEEAHELLVCEPVHLDGSPARLDPDDQPVVVSWTSAHGWHELATSLVAVRQERVPLWQLAVASTTRTTQLRHFTRSPDALGAQVVLADRSWGAVVSDLGEGGARAVIVETQELAAEDHVVLHVSIETDDLQLRARVLEVTSLLDGRSQLRLEFGDIGRAADVVRRRVLAQQRRARSVSA